MTIQFNLLKKKVEDKNIEFLEITNLATVFEDAIIFGNLPERTFFVSQEAATTLRNLTGVIEYPEEGNHKLVYKTSHSEVLQYLEDGDLQSIVNIINAVLVKKTLVICVVNNSIVGFYRNYNGIQHKDLLQEIKDFGLANRVMPSYVNDTDMLVNLRIQDKSEDEQYLFNLQVYNNLNSAKGLGYQLYFRFGKLEFTVDFENGSRKHLSKVGLVLEEIQNKLEHMQSLNITKTLKDTSTSQFMTVFHKVVDISKKKQLELLHRMDNFSNTSECNSALDLMGYLGIISDEHGFKLVSEKIGQAVIDELFNL